MHVVLAGGGTAGHVEPALALADALRRADAGLGVTALGTAQGLETRLVPDRGYDLQLIPRVPLPRRPTPALLTVPLRLVAAVRAAAAVIDRVGADVVVGFGGYVALPAYLAARRRNVPFVVHEANSRPGLANRVGALLTPDVAVSMPGTRLRHSRLVGIPLRRVVSTLDRSACRDEARRHFGLDPERATLLVFGGSQGARRLNLAMAAAARPLADAGIQVLHATGAGQDVTLDLPAGSPPYVRLPYVERMDLAYAAADLALCRAGAMTCAEIAAVGLPAVYVPLPIGNGEQRMNAAPVVDAGGGLLVDDAALNADWISSELSGVLTDPDRLRRMGERAAAMGRRDADEALADMVRAAAERGGSR